MRNWLWLDLETTGLDPVRHKILECAVVITTPDLEVVHEDSWLVDPIDLEKTLANTEPRVVDMHTKNGLFVDLIDESKPKVNIKDLDLMLAGIADAAECGRSPLCGSTPSFDRRFLEQHAPRVLTRLSHRHIDVSTVHEVCQAWFNSHHTSSTPKHRALDDVRFSIERLRWYRSRLFSPVGRK